MPGTRLTRCRAGTRHAAVVVLVAALSACAPGGAGGGTTGDPAAGGGGGGGATAGGVDLEGSWQLVTGRDAEGIYTVDGSVTLVVAGAGAEGRSACNLYSGVIEREGGDGVRFTGLGGTEMGCEPALMELEQRYLAALSVVERAARSGATLTLSGPDVALELEPAGPVQDADLVGNRWTLESMVDGGTVSSVLPGGELTFHEDGIFEGSSGCRPVAGRYERVGDKITVTRLRAELPEGGMCAGAAEVKHMHVVDVLRAGFTAEVEADLLTVTSPSRSGLALRAG
jgi:heat shock protein HslJ